MGTVISSNEQAEEENMSWLKKRFIHILMVVLVLVVAVIIFVYRDWVAGLGSWIG